MSLVNLQFLEYVRNTGGGATKEDFVVDWEPIGQRVWNDLVREGLVETKLDNKIGLSAKGAELLASYGRIPTP